MLSPHSILLSPTWILPSAARPRVSMRFPPAPILTDRALSWNSLEERVLSSLTGQRLQQEGDLRAAGQGPAHTDAKLRLFDAADESDIEVTFYRDSAAWCPYCQKVWLLLEEKRIPYRVEKLSLNAYGYKPSWFTRLVDGGKLPAIEIRGELIVESFAIMEALDAAFPEHGPQMKPPAGSHEEQFANDMLQLERELVRDWFSLTFYPVEGEQLAATRSRFLSSLRRVDAALGSTAGPWFLGGRAPSIVDLQYVSHVERMAASVLYWKGLDIRRPGDFPNLERWLGGKCEIRAPR